MIRAEPSRAGPRCPPSLHLPFSGVDKAAGVMTKKGLGLGSGTGGVKIRTNQRTFPHTDSSIRGHVGSVSALTRGDGRAGFQSTNLPTGR